MARTKSVMASRVPAVKAANKQLAQWRSMRNDYGDSRVATDLGFVPGHMAVDQPVAALSGGTLTGAFADRSLDVEGAALVSSTTDVVDLATEGLLIADVTKWGAIAVWLLAFVAAKVTQAGNDIADSVANLALRRIYREIVAKAGQGSRMAVVYGDDGTYALVPNYNGPADEVEVVYSALVDLGRAAAHDPGLDPVEAQIRAVTVIANRRWKFAEYEVRGETHTVSLDSLLDTDSAIVYTYNEDKGTPWAGEVTITKKDGSVRVAPATVAPSDVTFTPGSMGEMRLGSATFDEAHAKYLARPADNQSLAWVSRTEIINYVRFLLSEDADRERAGWKLCVAATILDLRGADSLRVVSESDVEEDDRVNKRYRLLKPLEIALEIRELYKAAGYVDEETGLCSLPVDKRMVKETLAVLAEAEDAYWSAVQADEEWQVHLERYADRHNRPHLLHA